MEETEKLEIEELKLASPEARLGAYLLDIALFFLTLIIGWIIWSLFTWQTGQTPAKRILKQQVVDAKSGEPFTFVRMLLREFAVKGVAGGLASTGTNGVTFVIDSLFIFRQDRKTLHDMVIGSKVVQL